MAQNKALEVWNGLPTWAKGVIAVGGVTVVFIIGRKLYKVVFPSSSEKKNRELVQDINSEINNASNQGQKPSYQDSNYVTFANTIYNSMRYCAGDDYGTVELNMKKMKNDLDVAKLIKAFGTRQDYCFGIPVGSPMDLFTYVQKELGNDWGGLTNYRVQNINSNWKSKGIKYQL